ncbi:MAG: hypothetical protein HY661_08395, partial [Betaproteobacteria bacterium]|nr:hypothetical protein [Betaproteobacteria bacterium]
RADYAPAGPAPGPPASAAAQARGALAAGEAAPAEIASPAVALAPAPAQIAPPPVPPAGAIRGIAAPARAVPSPIEPSAGERSPELPRGRVVGERFAATQAWLTSVPAGHYSIQLMTVKASELAQMENFLLRASKVLPPEEFHVYSVKIDGVQNYRAAYGLYPSVAETLAAMRELPPMLKIHKPYHRSVARMGSQNKQ